MVDPRPATAGPSWEEDVRLMALVAAADPEARRTLARRLLPRAQRLTRAILTDRIDADDATQNGLLEVMRAAGGYRGESALESWVDRVVARAALRVRRERRRREGRTDDAVLLERLPAIEPPTDALTEGSDVARCLASLPEELRTALVLRHVVGHSVQDVADLTSVSLNTAKARLLRAREALRKSVRREGALDRARERIEPGRP